MNWIYIVTWVVVNFSIVPYEPPISQYGLEPMIQCIPAVLYTSTNRTQKSKEFTSRAGALKFIQDAPTKYSNKNEMMFSTLEPYCETFKLDSVCIDTLLRGVK